MCDQRVTTEPVTCTDAVVTGQHITLGTESATNELLPLTAGDLRAVAEAIDQVEATALAANRLLGRIELYRPGGADLIGWVTQFDHGNPDMRWGFMPGGPQ